MKNDIGSSVSIVSIELQKHLENSFSGFKCIVSSINNNCMCINLVNILGFHTRFWEHLLNKMLKRFEIQSYFAQIILIPILCHVHAPAPMCRR